MNIILCWTCVVFLITCVLQSKGLVVYPEETWPVCYIGEGTQGSCERLVNCAQAVEAVYRGYHPPACYWDRYQTFPQVCCPLQGTFNVPVIPVVQPVEASAAQTGCGRVDGGNVVSDGLSSDDHVWPWMVSIYKEGEKPIPVGSGFLIDDKHVLSAAQNFPSPPQNEGWSVRLERTKREVESSVTPAMVYTVKDIKMHEGFRSWVRYDDLALITLDEPVQDAKPICLAPKDFDPNRLAGVNTTILGTHTEEEVPIVSTTWCSEMYAKFLPLSYPRGLDGEFFCAGLQLSNLPEPQNPDIMGGPVMTQTNDGSWMALGLVSLDYKCTEQGLPGVYLNLAHYRDWIDKQRAADA